MELKTESGNEALWLLGHVRQLGIQVWPTDDRTGLHFKATSGAVDEPLREKLRRNKLEIIECLSAPDFRSTSSAADVPFLEYYRSLWEKIRVGIVGESYTNATHWMSEATGPFSVETFSECIKLLAARYDALSARILEIGGLPFFRFDQPPVLEYVELNSTGGSSAESIESAVSEIVWRPFRVESDSLFRPFVLRISPQRHVIGFVLNHLVGDATSVGLVVTELMNEYQSLLRGAPRCIPDPGMGYRDYVLGMNAWLASKALDYRLDFWARKTSGIVECRIPVDREIPAKTAVDIAQYDFSLGEALARRVASLARELRTTPFIVLMAAQSRALSGTTGRDDVAFLTMHHGRDYAKWPNLVGSMQNQILHRIEGGASLAFDELVRSCHASHVEALEHQLPFHYVHLLIDSGGGSQHWFPEFNVSIHGGKGDASHRDSNGSSSEPNDMPRLAPYRFSQLHGETSRIGYFPGHKLMFSASSLEILGRIRYVSSEYQEKTMARFADSIRNAIAIG
jgi:hypothetical protein